MSQRTGIAKWLAASLVGVALMLASAANLRAHCDTMSGPVIAAARTALESGNVKLVLIWVQPKDEAAIRAEFDRALAAVRAGGPGKEAAEMRFFEALVRIHRAGEGAPFTGIKPEGTEVGPGVEAADRALASGTAEPVVAVIMDAVKEGIEKHYHAVETLKNYDPNDVAAGRAYVKAYVEYTHYAEGLYEKATTVGAHHEHAEGAAHEVAPVHGHGDAGEHGHDHH